LAHLTQTLTNSIAELRAAKEKLEAYEAAAEQERQRSLARTSTPQAVGTAKGIPSNPNKRIQVYEILADWGMKKRRTSIGDIAIRDLPREIGQYFDKVKQMRAEYARLSQEVEKQEREARRADAVALTGAGGDAAYVEAAMAERKRANLMMENVRDSKIALAKYKAALTSWENAAEEQTTILAFMTPQVYGGVQAWRFTSMAGKLTNGAK
jgi:hypothetical protein